MYFLQIASIFLVATAAITLVPLHLCLDLKIDGFSVTGFYKVKWFELTLRKVELSGPGEDEDIKRSEGKEKTMGRTISGGEDAKKKDTADGRSKFDRQRFLKDSRMFIDALPSFFRVLDDLMRTVHIKRLSLNITVGLDDPANTAVLCGYLWSLASTVSNPSTLHIDPYFGGDRLNGSVNAEIWGRLLWVFVAFINALREKPIRRLLKEMLLKDLRGLGNKLQIKPQMRRPLWGPKGKGNGNSV
jgi:hypothetical protein